MGKTVPRDQRSNGEFTVYCYDINNSNHHLSNNSLRKSKKRQLEENDNTQFPTRYTPLNVSLLKLYFHIKK